MFWLQMLAHGVGGAMVANAVPHLVSGMTGRSFQSPFARPPGRGLSSPTVNVLWGFANLAAGYMLVFHIGDFTLRSIPDVLAPAGGALVAALFSALHFGQFHGGGVPDRP